MTMRKMFLMGALFTGLVNVSAVGAWAAPSDPKLAALLAMPSDDGCPPTEAVIDETTELQPPDPKPVEPTPCERATKALEDADENIRDLTGRKQAAFTQLEGDQTALEAEANAQRQFELRLAVALSLQIFNTLTGDLANAQNARPLFQRNRDLRCNPVVREDAELAQEQESVFAESAQFFLPESDEGWS